MSANCFAPGTPVLTPGGAVPIETLRPGDLVLAWSEHDPAGAVEPKAVEVTFERAAALIRLVMSGRVVRTTKEHPLFVKGCGWRAAGDVRPGDRLASHDGLAGVVQGVEAEGPGLAQVYNLRVADYHTYFVGAPDWGFSVWVHNVYSVGVEGEGAAAKYFIKDEAGPVIPHGATEPNYYATKPEAEQAARNLNIDVARQEGARLAQGLNAIVGLSKKEVDSFSRELLDKGGNIKGIWGQLFDDGHVEFLISTVNTTVRGTELFKDMMGKFGNNAKSILGSWSFGTNLEEINKLVASGVPLNEAVKRTWTGKRAIEAGYGVVRDVLVVPGDPGKEAFKQVQVLFVK